MSMKTSSDAIGNRTRAVEIGGSDFFRTPLWQYDQVSVLSHLSWLRKQDCIGFYSVCLLHNLRSFCCFAYRRTGKLDELLCYNPDSFTVQIWRNNVNWTIKWCFNRLNLYRYPIFFYNILSYNWRIYQKTYLI